MVFEFYGVSSKMYLIILDIENSSDARAVGALGNKKPPLAGAYRRIYATRNHHTLKRTQQRKCKHRRTRTRVRTRATTIPIQFLRVHVLSTVRNYAGLSPPSLPQG